MTNKKNKYLHMKTILAFFLMGSLSCSSSKEVTNNFLENIDTVFYQKWDAGVQGGGSGIDFHVTLKMPLSKEIVLENLRFGSVQVPFNKENETTYIAKIISQQKDLILDENSAKEYGNSLPIKSLKPNEAYLLFKMNSKIYSKHLENVKEKPMIAYPSMERPKN
jgi:hypothetical protein